MKPLFLSIFLVCMTCRMLWSMVAHRGGIGDREKNYPLPNIYDSMLQRLARSGHFRHEHQHDAGAGLRVKAMKLELTR